MDRSTQIMSINPPTHPPNPCLCMCVSRLVRRFSGCCPRRGPSWQCVNSFVANRFMLAQEYRHVVWSASQATPSAETDRQTDRGGYVGQNCCVLFVCGVCLSVCLSVCPHTYIQISYVGFWLPIIVFKLGVSFIVHCYGFVDLIEFLYDEHSSITCVS